MCICGMQAYGKVVLGPNEIAVFAPEAFQCIHGPGTKCTKSAMYDMFWPYIALTTTRSNSDHEKRRRIWNRSLSIKGIEVNRHTLITIH
jgi:cytochrome P450 family 628